MSSLSEIQHEVETPAAPSKEVELLRRAQAGDRAAYGELVVAYQDRLYNAVLRIVGDREEARELTQEAFTRGLIKLDSFRGESGPYTWLFRIAVNLAISQLRRLSRHRVFSLESGGGNGDGRVPAPNQASTLLDGLGGRGEESPLALLEKRERHQQVLEALGRVDAESRALLVMRDIEGFDYQQMAEVLAVPMGTLKSKLFRARLALRGELAAQVRSGSGREADRTGLAARVRTDGE